MSKKAVCIFSGGLDSTCVLVYIKSKDYQVYALTFNYGQMSKHEIRAAESLADMVGVEEHKVIDISFMKELYKNSRNLLTNEGEIPSTFDYSIVVPIRNAVFLSIASAYAFSIDAVLVAYGAHKDDAIHYPDCRVEFISKLEEALNLAEADGIRQGVRSSISIWSPAVEGLGKADLIRIGYKLLGDNIFRTWSCYTDGIVIDNKERVQCGKCESCMNRKRAFIEAGLEDKSNYAFN